MFNSQVQFLDVNPHHWRRLFDAAFNNKHERGLTILIQNHRIVKAHDSAGGLRPEWKSLDPGDPEKLARQLYEAERPDWVQVLDVTALHEYGVVVQTMHNWREDSDGYLARCIGAVNHFPDGLVRYPPWPRELEIAGFRYSDMARLVASVPDGQTLALGVFDGDEVWASIVFRVRGGKIDLVTGTDAYLPHCNRWPNWRESSEEFIAGIKCSVGNPYLAVLCTKSFFDEMVVTGDKTHLLQDSKYREQVLFYPNVDMLINGSK